ncbi:EbsA family protein [Enterococcus olivae]
MEHKIRWYLESSLAIIYWSCTLISLFLSLIFVLEKAAIHWKSFFFLFIFLVLIYLSRKRGLFFDSEGVRITYSRFWIKEYYEYTEIKKICLSDTMLQIELANKVLEFKIRRKTAHSFYQEIKSVIPFTLLEFESES